MHLGITNHQPATIGRFVPSRMNVYWDIQLWWGSCGGNGRIGADLWHTGVWSVCNPWCNSLQESTKRSSHTQCWPMLHLLYWQKSPSYYYRVIYVAVAFCTFLLIMLVMNRVMKMTSRRQLFMPMCNPIRPTVDLIIEVTLIHCNSTRDIIYF